MSDNPRILDRDDVTVEDLFDLGAALALRIGTLEAVVCMLINLELEQRGMMPPPEDESTIAQTLHCLEDYVTDIQGGMEKAHADLAFLNGRE